MDGELECHHRVKIINKTFPNISISPPIWDQKRFLKLYPNKYTSVVLKEFVPTLIIKIRPVIRVGTNSTRD
jgi:hypothetical protein